MPTRSVTLTEDLDRFVLRSVESGRFENASEVILAALRSMEHDVQRQQEKMLVLQSAIDEGDRSGVAQPGAFSRVRNSLHLSGSR